MSCHRFEVGVRGRGPVSDTVPLSTVSVTVQVLDENDNSPQFHTVSPRLIHTGCVIVGLRSVCEVVVQCLTQFLYQLCQ